MEAADELGSVESSRCPAMCEMVLFQMADRKISFCTKKWNKNRKIATRRCHKTTKGNTCLQYCSDAADETYLFGKNNTRSKLRIGIDNRTMDGTAYANI